MRTPRLCFLLILAIACDSQEVQVRLAEEAPPVTLSDLRAKYDTTKLSVCSLAPVIVDKNWKTIAAPDEGLLLQVPRDFHLRPVPDSTFVGLEKNLKQVVEGPARSRIGLSRITRGAIGHRWLAGNERGDPADGVLCQIANGPVGSVWTLYAPGAVWTSHDPTGKTAGRFFAIGDLITPTGSRYWAEVGALSAEERDRLVRIVADAGLANGP
jgi:hypothetical protein